MISDALVPNPSVEFILFPKKQSAEVFSYNDIKFSYQIINQDDAFSMGANNYVNRLVYEWLRDIRFRNTLQNSPSIWLLQ